MPELNIEEKIQEALKKKSFKENKKEYLGLTLIFCLMLFLTFLACYFIPWVALLVILFVDIPFIMGYKHFIWFGPASGETLIDGFKVSIICGYLNFISYFKIFITTNIKAILFAILSFIVTTLIGTTVLEVVLKSDFEVISALMEQAYVYEDIVNAILENENILRGMIICEGIALIVALITFYLVKLNRAILPYISFLRLTSLEGKSMDGVIAHTKKVMTGRKLKFYLKSTLVHLWYLLPIGLTILVYFALSSNPVYSLRTLELLCSLTFFVSMFPAVLFVELNYRDFCINVNYEYTKEHKKMLNDAINDLEQK